MKKGLVAALGVLAIVGAMIPGIIGLVRAERLTDELAAAKAERQDLSATLRLMADAQRARVEEVERRLTLVQARPDVQWGDDIQRLRQQVEALQDVVRSGLGDPLADFRAENRISALERTVSDLVDAWNAFAASESGYVDVIDGLAD